ncbi:MAG: PspC domain-containing protein [Burkholderiaceae bacterium]
MSIAEDLDRLAALHQRGSLSEAEFAQAKARVLGQRERSADHTVATVNGLRRSRDDRWLGGVCGGLAQATGMAAWLWRLVFVLFVLCAGAGGLVYLLLWLLVPQEPLRPDHRPLHSG